jgi:hypothetical protein
MTQALYAHMNNKTITKKECVIPNSRRGPGDLGLLKIL